MGAYDEVSKVVKWRFAPTRQDCNEVGYEKKVVWIFCGLSAFLLLPLLVIYIGHYRKHMYPPEYFYKNKRMIELCKAISNADEKRIDKLLADGVDINKKGKHGMTPLLWAFKQAIKTKNLDVYEMILKKGGDPNLKITGSRLKGKSVMSLACLMVNDKYLETTLKYHKMRKNSTVTAKELIDVIDGSDASLTKVKMLVAEGLDINQPTSLGNLPVYTAARLNQWHIVYFFLQIGADPKLRDASDLSLFSLIEASNEIMSRKGFRYKYLRKCAKFLKVKGFNVDVSKPQKYPEPGVKQYYEE